VRLQIRVRICSWNIQFGERLHLVLDAVTNEESFKEVDVLALQEASVHDGAADAAIIAQHLGPDFDHFQATAQRRRGLEQANALIWRRSSFDCVDAPEVVPLPESAPIDLGPPERMLLRVIPPQTRMAVRAEAAGMRVYVVHLDVVGFAHKLEQFRAVLADMEQRNPVPLTVVAGDLNTFGPVRPHLWRRLAREAERAHLVNLTADVKRTHWTGQKLDAIYASSRVPFTHSAWTAGLAASDHLPVFADIQAAA
jgi:endonuclease/exonuclease/phosphatase family metal-dependent hydrolase